MGWDVDCCGVSMVLREKVAAELLQGSEMGREMDEGAPTSETGRMRGGMLGANTGSGSRRKIP